MPLLPTGGAAGIKGGVMRYCEMCRSITRHKVEVIHPQITLLTCTNCGIFGHIDSPLSDEETFKYVTEYLDRTLGKADGTAIIDHSPIDPVTGKFTLR